MSSIRMMRLEPRRWTALPGTNVTVRWDGEHAIVVQRCGGIWNLASLARPGRVLAWARLISRPELGAWPIVSLSRRATYRTRGGGQ